MASKQEWEKPFVSAVIPEGMTDVGAKL